MSVESPTLWIILCFLVLAVGWYFVWRYSKAEVRYSEEVARLTGIYRIKGFRDISQRKKVEWHVKLVSTAVEQSTQGIMLCDLDGTVMFVNKAWARQHGYEVDEIIGKHIGMFHTDRQMEQVLEGIEKVTSNGLFSGEIWHLHKDHSIYPTLTTASLLKDDVGRAYAILQVIQDITELKAIQRALEIQTKKALESSRLKSEFLSATSHELRTPLTSIIGFSKLVLDDVAQSREEEKELVADIYDSAHHLLRSIDQLLDIAKIESGKMELKPQEVDIKDIFDEVYNLTRIQAEGKGLELSFSSNDQSIPRVYADKEKLRQVLVNLVDNAIKFTDIGGVSVSVFPLGSEGLVRIEVADTGIGMSREDQLTAFERFVQADGSYRRKYGGVGLGLTISKSLIEMMGGSIEIDSSGIGRGTVASFVLPVYSG